MSACTSPDQNKIEFNLPDGFTIESAVSPDLIAYPMFASFDDHGRLFVFESTGTNDMDTEVMLSDPSYQIRLLTDTDQDGHFDKSVVFADEIPFPMGGTYYNGSLYVAASPDVLKFTDMDGDGQADKREVLLTGWTLNHNGAILSGPFMGPDGWMYVAGARRGFDITTKEGEHLQGQGARIWRFLPDGSRLEWLSGGGFDNSIEIDFMPSGDPIGTMTYFRDPADGQRDALMHWVKGGVYPKPQASIQQDQLKLTGDLMPVVTKMPRVAPSGIVRFRGDSWGSDYEGKWFSAIFNTGQILRHHIKPVDGSYQSQDEVFLSSELPDFHPTDVLQDGNGDLLIVVTGGWFIKGCPLSRVAKPEVPGGIYRIKKQGTTKYEDPWGTKLDFKEKTTNELAELLDDERPRVRKNALRELETRHREAINILEKRLQSKSEKVRLEALFALHRLGLKEGKTLVRVGLTDQSEAIRIAATRLTGLSQDPKAVHSLLELVSSDSSLRVRRQAATALGQIGDEDAIPGLLDAAQGIDDRFLLHAIRYALITFNMPDQIIPGLTHRDPSVQITGLIALDQMDDSPLTREQVRPFLTSPVKKLQEAGIWVTRHHPEWSSLVTNYLKKALHQSASDKSTLASLENLIVTFCGNSDIQSFVSDNINRSSVSEQVRISLLQVMSRCSGQMPDEWISSLNKILHTGSKTTQTVALDVIESRQIDKLETSLSNLLPEAANDPDFYLNIINARMFSRRTLSKNEFKKVRELLDSSSPIPLRRSALQVLDRAQLNEDQLMYLAQTGISTADEITLPGVVGIFKEDSTLKVGQTLITALIEKKKELNSLSESEMKKAISHYSDEVKETAQPLLVSLRKKDTDRLNRIHKLEEGLDNGDVGRGRELFFGKAICSTCHTVGKDGHHFGPDLTNIGEIRSRHDLLEAIVFPSVSFAREYETYVVKTEESTYTGVLKEELMDGEVVIMTAPGQEIRIPKNDVLSMESGDVSMMPPGLDQNLSIQELSDLIAFLEALPYTVDRLIELSE